jgi:hypothetical protein
MRLGIRLRRLWHLRTGVAACAALALLMAVWSVAKVSLSPPGLVSRGHVVAAASLGAEIDTSKSSLVDLREDTSNLDLLTKRAVLIGSVIASLPVRQAIARRAGVPLGDLQINPPLTLAIPATAVGGRETSITLRASATVPLLDIDARATSRRTAERLADATVGETQAYLAQVAASGKATEAARLRLVPLGHAKGSEIRKPVALQTPLLAFIVTFGIACATLIFITRVLADLRLPDPA